MNLPKDPQLERAVLGACMLESKAFSEIAEFVNIDTFYEKPNSMIYWAISELYEENAPIDIMTVTSKLRSQGTLDSCGGAFYITKLTNHVNQASNIVYHARLLVQLQIRRSNIKIATKLIADSKNMSKDVFESIDMLETQLNESVGGMLAGRVYKSGEVVQKLQEQAELVNKGKNPIEYITFGMDAVDRLLRCKVGQYIILAARPSMGKSALAGIAAYWNAKQGLPTLVYCRETSKEDFIIRMVCYLAKVTFEEYERTYLTPPEERVGNVLSAHRKQEVAKAMEEIQSIPLFIEETSGQSASQIVALAKRMKMQYNIKVVIGDYIQLATDPKKKNRTEEVSSISRAFHDASKNLKIAWIELSQLSRKIEDEDRSDKRPIMSDIRESGQIEQDAKVIIALYRNWYYGIEEDPETGDSTENDAELIILKNKNGANATAVRLRCDLQYFDFYTP